MRSVYVSLPTVKAVQSFVSQISKLEGDFDLIDGRYILDAKSIMGILTLNLRQPLKLTIEKDTEETMQIIQQFVCDTEIVSVDTTSVMSVV